MIAKEKRVIMHRLIQDGLSLNKISKKIGIAKSTIYEHYKRLRGRKYVRPSFVISNSEEEGEIIGAFAADGGPCVKDHYRVAYFFGQDEEDYARDFATVLESYFHKKPFFYRTGENHIKLGYLSKNIYSFMENYLHWTSPKTYSIMLKRTDFPEHFLKGFLRGYIDCDGYVGPYGAQYVGVSQTMMKQICEILAKLGFNANIRVHKSKNKNYAPCYYVKLNKTETLQLLEFINPRNNKRKWDCRGSNTGHNHPKVVAYH